MAILITLVYPFTSSFPLMTGSFVLGIVGLYKVSNFLSEFNTLSYADMYMLASFLWYVISDDFDFSSGLTLYPLSVITCAGSLSYVNIFSKVVIFSNEAVSSVIFAFVYFILFSPEIWRSVIILAALVARSLEELSRVLFLFSIV